MKPEDALYFMMGRRTVAPGDFFKNRDNPNYKVSKGDIIEIDSGVHYKDYNSDLARTFIVGKPNSAQKRIFDALKAGHDAMLSMIKPGVRFKDVFNVGQETIRKSGLPRLERGHFGHIIGIGHESERSPFITPSEEQTL